MAKSTSTSAAGRKPAALSPTPDSGPDGADVFFLPPEVQNGTLRYDPVGNLEPSPGYTAVTPPDLQPSVAESLELDFEPEPQEPTYIEPRSVLNPAIVLPDDSPADGSADAIPLADLPASFPRPFTTEGPSELPGDSSEAA